MSGNTAREKTIREIIEELKDTSIQISSMKDNMLDILFRGETPRDADRYSETSEPSIIEQLKLINDLLLNTKKEISELLNNL